MMLDLEAIEEEEEEEDEEESSVEGNSEEYEDLSEEEEDEEDGKRLKLQCQLQLTGHTTRLKGLQELKELYGMVNSRLTWSKEDEDSRLKKAESKVVSFLVDEEEDEDKESDEDYEDPDEKKELKVFEKMEKLTGRPSFGSKLSIVDQFMNNKICLDSTTQSEITEDEINHVSEETESKFQEEQRLFEMYKAEEEAKLEYEKSQLTKDQAKVQKMKTEAVKIKKLNQEYVLKISQLEDELKKSNSEWSRKFAQWNLTRTKMKKQIDELEKRCNVLETKVSKPVKPPLPPKVLLATGNKQPKRIQFENTTAPKTQKLPLKSSLKQPTATENRIENLPQVGKENQDPESPPFNPKNHQPQQQQSPKMDLADLSNEGETVETIFPNGTKKYVCKARKFTRTIYKNGDIKEKRSDGSIHYFFANFGLRHYVYPNGLEMTTYNNGQIQRKNPDGTVEILYPNGCVKLTRCNGKEEFIFPDNTVCQMDSSGNTVIMLPTGQKEIHNELWKKRIFPDGTTKTVYSDGSYETRYPNGRVRVKNAEGMLISDTDGFLSPPSSCK